MNFVLKCKWLLNCLRWCKAELIWIACLLLQIIIFEPCVDNIECCIVDLLIGVLLQLFNLVDHIGLFNFQRQLISAAGCVCHIQHIGDTIENDLGNKINL